MSCYFEKVSLVYWTHASVRFIFVHITLCAELHRPFVHPFFRTSPLVGACWIRLVYMGHPPLSSYQEVSSLAAPAPNFPLALLLISTQSHTWDVTAVDSPEQRASTLCCALCMCVCVGTPSVCGVKGAIHEQLAGVKSGQSWAAVYDICMYLCVCLSHSVRVCVSICLSLWGNTWNWCGHNKVSVDFYKQDQIALEEDYLYVGSIHSPF